VAANRLALHRAQIEETVLRTLRRLGWARLEDDEKKSA
jgi:hypothetical protein